MSSYMKPRLKSFNCNNYIHDNNVWVSKIQSHAAVSYFIDHNTKSAQCGLKNGLAFGIMKIYVLDRSD